MPRDHSTSIRGSFGWCVGRSIGHARGKHRLKTHLVYHSYITRRSIIIRKGLIKLGLGLRTSNDKQVSRVVIDDQSGKAEFNEYKLQK